MLTLFGLAVCGYLVLVAGLYVMQRQLLYLPDRSIPSRTASGVPEMSEVRLHTDDGLDLLAWYRPAAPGRATILYLHGNGGHIGYRGDRVRPFIDAGFGVLLVEYRGYGGNPGHPSEPGLMSDVRAALVFLDTAGASPTATVLYGESLGSTVAVAIAAEQAATGQPVAALVLEAPLSSVSDIAAHHYPWVPVRWLLKDRFEAVARIAHVGAPVLIIHGEADDIVPIRYGRALFEAAAEPKEAAWIRGGGHEDLAEFGLRRIVLDFLARRLRGLSAPLSRPAHGNAPPDAPDNAEQRAERALRKSGRRMLAGAPVDGLTSNPPMFGSTACSRRWRGAAPSAVSTRSEPVPIAVLHANGVIRRMRSSAICSRCGRWLSASGDKAGRMVSSTEFRASM